MKWYKIIGIVIPAMMLQGCPGYGYKYNKAYFPTTPVNFTEINTVYDDYNATSPILGNGFPLCFSSSRNSGGANFDIVYKFISIEFSKTTGELSIFEGADAYQYFMGECSNLVQGVRKINTPEDELGPYLMMMDHVSDGAFGHDGYTPFIMLYSNNIDGNQDIRFTHNTGRYEYEDPLPVSFLNSDADDAYPCFNADRSALYFCSSREGDFDIYRARTDPEKAILDLLSSSEALPIEKDTLLSSEGDDKCPYLAYNNFDLYGDEMIHNLLVFASNREGGYGGYDLYYSPYVDGQWEEPVNFGAGINTEYDEYRPIVLPQWEFENDFMIFSSNRTGGLGGFDLYYVGIPAIGYPTGY